MTISETIALIAAIISGIGIIVTIIIFLLSNRISNRKAYIGAFDNVYEIVFSIKKEIERLINMEFHFELDNILGNKQIEIRLLEYLTKIENVSMLIIDKNHSYKNLFNKLSSVALYKRMLCLVPYILYKQNEQHNKQLFSNYLSLINQIESIKISSVSTKRVYSGIRYSDIEFDKEYFEDRICLFDSEKTKAFMNYRANQNYCRSDFTNHYAISFIEANKKNNDDYQLILYNQRSVYELSPQTRNHAICYNDENLLCLLNDKILMREIIRKAEVKIPTFSVINGSQITSDYIGSLCNNSRVVIQTTQGGGGVGTYLFDISEIDNHLNLFDDMRRYIISNYIEHSISVNVHVIISKSSNVITPGSVQLIEVIDNQLSYRGADFISFRDIPYTTREEIRKAAIKICNILRNEGYLGIAGIDFIIDENETVYCSEINPRYQSSTIIISKYLKDKTTIFHSDLISADVSIYEINAHAFDDIIKNSISFYDEINYSCYFYYNDANGTINSIKKKIEIIKQANNLNSKGLFKVISVNTDGLENFDESLINNRSYLFRVVYGNKISEISKDHQLWINNNVRFEAEPKSDLELKIALVNQGVRINKSVKYKQAVFSGIDFYIPEKSLYINAPVSIGLSVFSPYEIICSKNNYKLFYYNKFICNINIEQDYSAQLKTKASQNVKDILYISSDRIRIKPINGCDFKSNNEGCKFCELRYSRKHYTLTDIEEAIKESIKLDFNHILIGGGTDLSANSWENLKGIVKLIKKYYPDKQLSLMSIPTPIPDLKELKQMGVTEVAFNIEIFDEKIAFDYMPGKRNYNFDVYYKTLREAVIVFGRGNVRSAFVIGLESTESLIKGVKKICEIGVLPCLSIYRCTTNSLQKLNPTNEYLKCIYEQVLEITNHYELEIGPKCKACQNNMLVI